MAAIANVDVTAKKRLPNGADHIWESQFDSAKSDPALVVHSTYTGIEAVIDKDHASALLAHEIGAQALLMLTYVDGVYQDWGTSKQSLVTRTTPAGLRKQKFASGSMDPKVEAVATYRG